VTDLSAFDNSWFSPGRSRLVRALWFFLGLPLVRCRVLPGSGPRRALLRLFGARVGEGVVIKPGVRVKYPWHFSSGAHCWIGEDVWIDNLAPVTLGDNACVSQGAYLGTGNHDWTDPAFGLIVRPVTLGDGAWVGARAVVCPGVSVGECGIAAAGSVVSRSIPPYEIHAGNPAGFVRVRKFAHEHPAHQPVLCA
jgi:putative colanic acid biosynthesis acetyltransferase WcaF